MLKDKLKEAGIKFTYANISENLSNLKVFLGYRDSLEMFREVKENGRVGIPFIVVNKGEMVMFDDDDLDLSILK